MWHAPPQPFCLMKPALVVWLEKIMVFLKRQLAKNKKWEEGLPDSCRSVWQAVVTIIR